MAKNKKSGSDELNHLLEKLNQEGNFPISILTDSHGLALAAAAQPGLDPDRQSAVVGLVQKTVNQAGRQLGMAGATEFTLHDANGQRLVCRPFAVKDNELILAVMVPGREQSYRRVTSRAITDICQVWKNYWE